MPSAQGRRVRKAFDHVDAEMMTAIQRVLEARHYYLGPENEAFEEEVARYLGCDHAVAVNSGTSGMFLILKALGIGPGNEVIAEGLTRQVLSLPNHPGLSDADIETIVASVASFYRHQA
jgi:dTDP-4-amino-4,6-dideoxygalactose transaminase